MKFLKPKNKGEGQPEAGTEAVPAEDKPKKLKAPKAPKEPKAPKAAKALKVVRSKAPRYVVFIGDEGAILTYMQNGKVIERLFAPNAEPENTREFVKLCHKDPKASVSILVDMMDQSFVRHTLPPVTSLSVNKLVQRRLERDFAPEDIKGAISLGREKDGRKDWNYLLIALASSPQLKQWLNLVGELPNKFEGIYLVPVEAEQFMRQLSSTVNEEAGRQTAPWQLLVSHNRVGGFRQVVLKDGKLIFTRMAQPIGESMPEVIAGNIEQEVQNTVEYLKRLSLQDYGNLEIYIIASREIKNSVDMRKFNVASANVFTPFEVAEILGLPDAVNPADHFGDVLLSVNFGSAKKHVLKLITPYTKKLEGMAAARMGLRYAASLACMAMIGYAGYTLFNIQPVIDSIADAETRLQTANANLTRLREQTSSLPADIDRITDVVSVYETFAKDDLRPLSFVADLGKLTGEDVVVESLRWNREEVKSPDGSSANKLNVTLGVEFLKNTEDIDRFVKFANSFFVKARDVFKDYEVKYDKLPGTVADDETMQVSFDSSSEGSGQDQFVEGKPVVVQVSVAYPKETSGDPNQPGGAGAPPPMQ